MDYETGIRLDRLEQKMDFLLQQLFGEKKPVQKKRVEAESLEPEAEPEEEFDEKPELEKISKERMEELTRKRR